MGLEGIEGGMEEADVPAGAACEGQRVGPDSRKTVDKNVKGNVEGDTGVTIRCNHTARSVIRSA